MTDNQARAMAAIQAASRVHAALITNGYAVNRDTAKLAVENTIELLEELAKRVPYETSNT